MPCSHFGQGDNSMKVLGITGGVGAGKSTVLAYMRDAYQAKLILCDEVGAELQMPGGACYEPMRQLLGDVYIHADGTWNRPALAAALFADEKVRHGVNAIVHPAVKTEVRRLLRAYEREGAKLAVVEAALLLEDHYNEICDEIWYIHTDREVRIARLMASRGYSRQKAEDIMSRQLSDETFSARCALTVDNSDENVQNTYDQIDKGLRTHGFLYDSQREQR